MEEFVADALKLTDKSKKRARWVIAATGGLSVPHYPEIDGVDDFQGQAYHTGAWPHTPVDFAGKRVAIIGNGPSGTQLLPAIAGTAAAVDLYQRTPTWAISLYNAPISDERQAWLSDNFDDIVKTLSTAPSGFLHEPAGKFSTADSPIRVLREDLEESRLHQLRPTTTTTTTNREVNLEFCAFLADKIRCIVTDPVTAERLTAGTKADCWIAG